MMAVMGTNSRPSAEPTHYEKFLEKSSQFSGFQFYMQFSFTFLYLIPPARPHNTNQNHTDSRYTHTKTQCSGGCRICIRTLVHMNFIITIYAWFLFADNEENCEFSNVMEINCDMTLCLQFFICLSEWTFNRLIWVYWFGPQRVGAACGVGMRNAHLWKGVRNTEFRNFKVRKANFNRISLSHMGMQMKLVGHPPVTYLSPCQMMIKISIVLLL